MSNSIITVVVATQNEPAVMAELILLQRQGMPLEVTVSRGKVARVRQAPRPHPVNAPTPQRQAAAPAPVRPRRQAAAAPAGGAGRVREAAVAGRAAREAAAAAPRPVGRSARASAAYQPIQERRAQQQQPQRRAAVIMPATAVGAQVTYRVVDQTSQVTPRNQQVRDYLLKYGPATRAEVQAAFEAHEGAEAGSLNKAIQSALHTMKAEGVVVSEPIS